MQPNYEFLVLAGENLASCMQQLPGSLQAMAAAGKIFRIVTMLAVPEIVGSSLATKQRMQLSVIITMEIIKKADGLPGMVEDPKFVGGHDQVADQLQGLQKMKDAAAANGFQV